MDEHVPATVSQGLRRRGVDVLTAQEASMVAVPDEQHLTLAVRRAKPYTRCTLYTCSLSALNRSGLDGRIFMQQKSHKDVRIQIFDALVAMMPFFIWRRIMMGIGRYHIASPAGDSCSPDGRAYA